MGFNDLCNSGLVLQLGLSSSSSTVEDKSQPPVSIFKKASEPSLTLSLSGYQTFDHQIQQYPVKKVEFDHKKVCTNSNDQSGASSLISNVSVKREREIGSEEMENRERVTWRASEELDDDDGPNGRKKLRLTKAQSVLLEESFKQHSTLNPKQKQELARELKLRPRQVEVWFQNRRARTKVKQTEVDCELLKKCCETLTDENRRLRKELNELKLTKPRYMQLPAAALTICPSCESICPGGKAATSHFNMAPKPHFYTPFTNPSAAC